MLDLPADDEGLSWIVSQDSTQLLLIPGLLPASIVAAAAGDQQAFAHLRSTAQRHATHPNACPLSALDRVCLEASQIHGEGECFEYFQALEKKRPRLFDIHHDREYHTLQVFDEAVHTGKLAAFRWMRAICAHVDFDTCEYSMRTAAKGGQLEVIQYLRSRPSLEYWNEGDAAAAAPYLDCIKWMLSTDASGGPCPCRNDILCKVAHSHGLPALQWFRANCQLSPELWNQQLLAEAVRLNDQPMLAWLRAQSPPIPWDSSVCEAAAKRGDISTLTWLRSQDPPAPWDENVAATAASGKDARTLEWLRAQCPPCPWDARCCAAAALSGQLDTLIWLRAQQPPCPLDATCALKAADGGHQAVLEWLSAHGVLLAENLWARAARNNRHHILRFLHRERVPLPETSLLRLLYTRPSILMLLADAGARLNDHQMQQVTAARRAYCTVHGLVRWCRRAICQPGRGSRQGFNTMATDCSGQLLLARLCLLPPELVSKITLAANIHCNMLVPSS